MCRAFLQLVSTVIMIAVGAPFALPALLVMMGVFYALYKFFMASVRQAKRLEAVSRRVGMSRVVFEGKWGVGFRAHVCSLRGVC